MRVDPKVGNWILSNVIKKYIYKVIPGLMELDKSIS